jgi:hypothetical protein
MRRSEEGSNVLTRTEDAGHCVRKSELPEWFARVELQVKSHDFRAKAWRERAFIVSEASR